MEFSFKKLPERFQKPLSILGERYHFIESASGREIEFISGDENHLKICADEHKIVISTAVLLSRCLYGCSICTKRNDRI